MQIEKMVVISTAHIDEETAKMLNEGAEDYPPFCDLEWSPAFARDHGWLFHVASVERVVETNPPQCLRNVFAFARALGCEWVMLDCDGDRVDGLPSWEW